MKCCLYKYCINVLYRKHSEHVQSQSGRVSNELWADRPPLNHDHWMCCCSSETTWDSTHLKPIKTSKSQREAVTPLSYTNTNTHTYWHTPAYPQSCEQIPERLKITWMCVRIHQGWRVVKSADDMVGRFLWKWGKTQTSVVTLFKWKWWSLQQLHLCYNKWYWLLMLEYLVYRD